MKYIIPFVLISAVLICSYLNNSVQAQEITILELYPENPTIADDVLLVVSTSFPFLDCRLDSIHPYYACGAFSYDAFYGTSFESGYCERTDTINMGTLAGGLNTISFRMYYLGWSQVDQVDTSVIVGSVGISDINDEAERSVSIWPNPSHGSVNIKANGNDIDELRFSNASGSYMQTLLLNDSRANAVNNLSLPPGLYICTAISRGYPVSTSKFIILGD